MKIAIPKMCTYNSFKTPVDHGIIQFISTCKWHKWRNAKVFKYNEVIFTGENKSYHSSVQNNVLMFKMLDIYRSIKLLNSALWSENFQFLKRMHRKIVAGWDLQDSFFSVIFTWCPGSQKSWLWTKLHLLARPWLQAVFYLCVWLQTQEFSSLGMEMCRRAGALLK